MDGPKRTMTREELHELVWSTPMQKLAEIYGLSDRGLAKTCQRHLVPVPGRGYWAKVEAGQHPKRTRLRSVENTELHTVHIGSRPPVKLQSPYVAQVLAAAAKEIEREDLELTSNKVLPPPAVVEAPSPETAEDIRPFNVPQEIRAFAAELRRLQTDRDGFIYFKYIKVSPNDLARIELLIGRLASELARYGFTFNDKTNRVGFSKDGSTVDFEIKAPRKRITTVSRSGWKHFEYQHIGKFEFQIYGWAEGVTKQWADKGGSRVEDSIPKIVKAFASTSLPNGREMNTYGKRPLAKPTSLTAANWRSNAQSEKRIAWNSSNGSPKRDERRLIFAPPSHLCLRMMPFQKTMPE